jgi:hypothetical protein
VPILPEGTTLGEKRYATLILRLVLDRQGRLLYGELVDVEDGHPDHFSGWRGMISAVRVWLKSQA